VAGRWSESGLIVPRFRTELSGGGGRTEKLGGGYYRRVLIVGGNMGPFVKTRKP